MATQRRFDTHLFEPIAQLVYRGSGPPRRHHQRRRAQLRLRYVEPVLLQPLLPASTGRRRGCAANIGGHLLGSFADGSWLDLVAGQSFHLAGTNALGISDAAQAGTSTGLGTPAFVHRGRARGGFPNGLSGAGKAQVDPSRWRITRAGVGVSHAPPATVHASAPTTSIVAAEPGTGATDDQHEIAGRGDGGPFADY